MRALLSKSLSEHRAALDRREYSSVELTQAYLDIIESQNEENNAFLFVDREGALARAKESDRRLSNGEGRGVLEGIPFSLKDNIAAKGMPMTCGSRILEGYRSPYDATVNVRLLSEGAVLLGKNNMDEFAIGSTGEHSAYKDVKNPRDPLRVAGGSSSGSAAAVAAGMTPFSLGTDTGGSIRQPAAFCGVVGFKPSYGVLSRYGVAAMASSLDTVGILARNVEDCGTVIRALAGRDPLDATSRDITLDARIPKGRPLRVALVKELCGDCAAASVRGAISEVIDRWNGYGAECYEEALPDAENMLASYTVIAACETASNLSRYDGVRFGARMGDGTLSSLYEKSRALIGDEALARILFGIEMLSGENRERYYLRALRVREEVCARMRMLGERYDLILSPVAPTAAFAVGSRRLLREERQADLCTVYASLARLPSISLPMGTDENGLPLAVQLCAGEGRDAHLLALAEQLIKQK